MNPRDAEFQIGDWSKSHKLTSSKIEGHPDLLAVSCSCGWSVLSGADMAKRMGTVHMGRAAYSGKEPR